MPWTGCRRWTGVLAVVAMGGLAACAAGPSAPPVPTPACSPAVELTGFSDALDELPVAGGTVAGLSGLALDRGRRLLALADRSTLYTLAPPLDAPSAALELRDETGAPLDAEALVVEPDGTLLVASETEPGVRAYTPDGRLVGRLPVPPELAVAPAGRATENRTFEGLALGPDGRTLVASVEGALAGDDPRVRRFVVWQRDGRGAFQVAAQLGYRADDGLDVSDITATGDGRLLVVERTYTDDVGNTVRLHLTDPHGGADVSGVPRLGADPDAPLLPKTLLTDLASCPPLGATARQAQPNPLLDNVEGMTVAGAAPDGRLDLVLVSDDNARPAQTTRLYFLAVRLPAI